MMRLGIGAGFVWGEWQQADMTFPSSQWSISTLREPNHGSLIFLFCLSGSNGSANLDL